MSPRGTQVVIWVRPRETEWVPNKTVVFWQIVVLNWGYMVKLMVISIYVENVSEKETIWKLYLRNILRKQHFEDWSHCSKMRVQHLVFPAMLISMIATQICSSQCSVIGGKIGCFPRMCPFRFALNIAEDLSMILSSIKLAIKRCSNYSGWEDFRSSLGLFRLI